MKNHNLPTSTPLSFPEASPDADEADDILAFADRIREMYRSAETIGDHFRDLASQGKFNELSEAIDAQIDGC